MPLASLGNRESCRQRVSPNGRVLHEETLKWDPLVLTPGALYSHPTIMMPARHLALLALR